MSPRGDGHLRILPRDLVAYALIMAAILGQWYALNAKLDRFIEVTDARYRAADADRQRIWDILVKRAEASEADRTGGEEPRR